jgi:hypothetical protein
VDLMEVRENALDVIQGVRALRMARVLDPLPWSFFSRRSRSFHL